MIIRVLCCLLLLVGTASAQTPNPVTPSQRQAVNSGELTSTANAAVAHTITGVTNQTVRLISFKARCSAGTSTITITDGGTTVWTTSSGAIGATDGGAVWIPPRLSAVGSTVVVTLGACGGGNTGKLNVQADRW